MRGDRTLRFRFCINGIKRFSYSYHKLLTCFLLIILSGLWRYWAAGGPQGQGESARRNQMVVEESSGRSVASVVLMEALLQVKLVLRVASAQPRWELLVLSARSVFQAHQVQREHQAQREYLQLVWVA